MDASPFSAILSQLFWLFFIFLAVMPMIRQRMLESARLSLIRQIEKKRGSRVIVLIHRQESLALFGVPLFRFISVEDSEEVLRAIRMTPPDMPIDIILHTPGGLVLASQQIACALCDHKAKVTAFVPHYAMSGGTLIALAADEIVMDSHAVLGSHARLPHLGKYAAVDGLSVRTDMPAEVYQLMALYPQPVQRTSGVDYVPVPYHPETPSQPQRAPAARRRNAKVN